MVAHEFGHAFGLGDAYQAYPDINRISEHSYEGYVINTINRCKNREIWCDVLVGFPQTQYKEGCGEIMMFAGDVLPNDVEMLVMAFATGKQQKFVFNGFSTAIKDNENKIIVYHVCKEDGKVIIKYYTLNLKNNKLKEIKKSEVQTDKKKIEDIGITTDVIYHCPDYPG